MLTPMKILAGVGKTKEIYFYSAATIALVSLVLWATQGCAQSQIGLVHPPAVFTNNQPAASSAPSQSPQFTGLNQSPPISGAEQQFIDFQKTLCENAKNFQLFLQTQADHHEHFLEICYSVFGGLIAGAVILLTVFNIRNSKDLQRIAKKRMDDVIDREIDLVIGKANTAVTNLRSQVAELKIQFKRDEQSIITLSSILARAHSVLSLQTEGKSAGTIDRDNQERSDVIKLLKEVQAWWPSNRVIAIVIGRLNRQLKNWDAAIDVLNSAIEAKSVLPDEKNTKDQADLLFNKACYKTLQAGERTQNADKERLYAEAWSLLMDSVKIYPANSKDAEGDKDFAGITSEKRTWESLHRLASQGGANNKD